MGNGAGLGRLSSYFRHHQLVAVESLNAQFLAPLSSLLTWLVVAIALTLPGALYMAVDNIQQLSGQLESSGSMSLFLKDTELRQAQALQRQLRQHPKVARVEYVSAEQGLADFSRHSGLADALSYLDHNPLPAVLLVEPKLGISTLELNKLLTHMRSDDRVDSVQVDMAWMARLQALLALAKQLVWVLGILLALAILLVIGNSIRLAIAARCDEIRVIKLVGGSDAYVRRPFLYTGLWYGLIGGLLAWSILGLCWLLLRGAVGDIAQLYTASFYLQPLALRPSLALIALGTSLGLLGAAWSVQRQLAKIEP